jgi:hypothetical protein
MGKYKFYARDKSKEVSTREFCFIWMPKKARETFGITLRSDVTGYVEAENKDEAEKIAKGQIKRMYSHCRLIKVEEDK